MSKGYLFYHFQSEKPFDLIAVLRAGHYHRISSAAYTRDSSMLITASYDSSCVVWCVPEYNPLYHYWHMGRVPSLLLLGGANNHHLYGVAVAPDSLHFCTICEDRCVRLWPLAASTSPTKTYYELALSTIAGLKMRSVAFSHCGRLVAVTTSDSRVLLFTTNSQFLSLTNQCVRAIRSYITKYLMFTYPRQPDGNGPLNYNPLNDQLSCLLQQAIQELPLPPHVLNLVTCDFSKSSRPYYYYPTESCPSPRS
ncbi:unnamed protein product [Echinostoma caproni]|uniref:WD_REPEATS_REGION domain-containing protein n=1 Tax=Echinostoma caproni TaxID=27848 RepID=A0A183AX57_9TREM|nr:unnamed protein product [Echinostoma caproni]